MTSQSLHSRLRRYLSYLVPKPLRDAFVDRTLHPVRDLEGAVIEDVDALRRYKFTDIITGVPDPPQLYEPCKGMAGAHSMRR